MEDDSNELRLILSRLERIEQALQGLRQEATSKERYTVEEAASILKKAPFTVREWCRHGRIRADKRACGRGGVREWSISHEELDRIRNDGLLPVGGFVYRYRGG